MIEKHALESSGGKTYAELDREDPTRQTVMTASFLRSSLFTSVVAFGVAFMAAGLGVVLIGIGIALLLACRRLSRHHELPSFSLGLDAPSGNARVGANVLYNRRQICQGDAARCSALAMTVAS